MIKIKQDNTVFSSMIYGEYYYFVRQKLQIPSKPSI